MGRRANRGWKSLGRILLAATVVFSLVPAHAAQQNSAAHVETTAKPYEDPDAYAIYSILLGNHKDSTFVIEAETESYPGITPEGTEIKGDRKFQRVWGAAVNDFARRYSSPNLLTRNISIEAPYEFLSKPERDAIFKAGEGWGTFYKRYPLSRGLYWFSAVGFDRRKAHAIVQMNYRCGGLCGHGEPHYLEKQHGKWREVKVYAGGMYWES